MRSVFTLVCLIILIAAKHSMAQTDDSIFNTMTFFYIDNSSDAKHKGLNSKVKKYLSLKLKEQADLKGNYFYFFAANGKNPISETKLNKLTDSDILTNYLSQPSATADYESDNKKLQIQFTKTAPVKISDTLKVFLFLSYNAVNRMVAELNNMPTPAVFPTELSSYINRDKIVRARIFIITDKAIKLKYTNEQLNHCFSFNDNNTYIQPIIEFK
ncbi:MAG: hypothetical protein ABI723_01315 [Bacteroidia bacterium]